MPRFVRVERRSVNDRTEGLCRRLTKASRPESTNHKTIRSVSALSNGFVERFNVVVCPPSFEASPIAMIDSLNQRQAAGRSAAS
jgi:hypothetical protein